VNTIKKFKFLLISILFFYTESEAFGPKYERELYIGCYSNSKIYLGPDKAKQYCLCTINKLSKRYTDKQIEIVFQKTPEEIIKATEFAAIDCEKN
tara:strand:+ start:708 stop:992 length:285 start_codon:yes stop_codon:yes gene_type:complete